METGALSGPDCDPSELPGTSTSRTGPGNGGCTASPPHKSRAALPGQRGTWAYPSCPTCGLQGPLPPGPGSLEDDWLLGELLKGRLESLTGAKCLWVQSPDPARCVLRMNSLL